MRATIPLRHTFTHTPFTGMGEDPRTGNDVPQFGNPVTRRAYAYSPHKTETTNGHTSQVVAEVDLACPDYGFNLLDKITLNGTMFEVVGVRNNNGGFHGFEPGVVVELVSANG